MTVNSNNITATGSTSTQYQGGVAPTSSGDVLGKDAFLKLLITQMQNQDPLNPTDNSESIAQMAQFSSLEQMQNMVTSSEQMQAANMLGKTITAEIPDGEDSYTTKIVSGVVAGTKVVDGETMLVVGSDLVGLDKVQTVEESATAQGADVWQLSSLLGKTVTAQIPDSTDETQTQIIGGVVEAISTTDGEPRLIVGNNWITPDQILEIIQA